MTAAASPDVWARPALAAQILRPLPGRRARIALAIPALADPVRVIALERTLQALPGIVRIGFDVAARRARLTLDTAALSVPGLLRACAAAGCPATPLHRDQLEDRARLRLDDSTRRLLVAGAFAMQAMMFSLVLYFDAADPLGAATERVFRWLAMLMAAPVVGYAAWPFYRDAAAALRRRRLDIDAPVAVAVVLIFLASAFNTLRGAGEVYFDSVSMFVFVLLLGRHLVLRDTQRHSSLRQRADDATPLLAQRLRSDGATETVSASELRGSDRILVREGDATPCAGVLENPSARIDTAATTGESRPQAHRAGDLIPAGSVALGAPMTLRVSRSTGTRTGEAPGHAPPVSPSRDAVAARRFVWRVGALVLATAAFWLWQDPTRAFAAVVAVLVVACPCAFGLAGPAALTRAVAVLARRGILVLRPEALRRLADATRVVFDKTGTLTIPSLAVDRIETFRGTPRDEALRLAVTLAQASSHPLAGAVIEAALDAGIAPLTGVATETAPDRGLRGTIAGRPLRLGRPNSPDDASPEDDDALWLTDAVGPLARFPIEEAMRTDAGETVTALRDAGMVPILLSGDAPERVQRAAAALGIARAEARQSPDDKRRRVRAEQAAGEIVLMIGDGGNDASALAAADISATPAQASALARTRADLVLGSGLSGLVAARVTATRTAHITRINRRWALAWNLGAVPLAALGFIPPWLAMAGMATSSLVVVLNTLRIRDDRTEPRTNPAPEPRAA